MYWNNKQIFSTKINIKNIDKNSNNYKKTKTLTKIKAEYIKIKTDSNNNNKNYNSISFIAVLKSDLHFCSFLL